MFWDTLLSATHIVRRFGHNTVSINSGTSKHAGKHYQVGGKPRMVQEGSWWYLDGIYRKEGILLDIYI